LQATKVRAAWNFWGGPQAINWGGVRVGQIDTGYTRHPALGFAQNTWVQVNEGQTFFAPGADPGGPGPGGGVDPLEVLFDGHGTRVASVICGDDPAAPGGRYLGVAPGVPLVPVRIANIVLISHAQRELATALRYLVRDAKVSVINLSMGFLPRTQIRDLDKAIDETYEAGVIFVCAAGQPLSSVVSPAHGRRTLAIAGSTQAGIPWSESARGSAVDWTAPAKGLFRADAKHDGSLVYAGGGDGTSYAAAISTGAAALWLARHGSAIASTYPQAWQRVEAFKAVARATAVPMPNQQTGSFGTGILDVDALLKAPLPPAASLQPERPA
jgi:Subtilase family